MSKEVELPGLSKHTEQDLRLGDSAPAYAERTIQLREALAQIATLSAQVEELRKVVHMSLLETPADTVGEFEWGVEPYTPLNAVIHACGILDVVKQEWGELWTGHDQKVRAGLSRVISRRTLGVEKAEAELAALREDKLRLDWLDNVRPSLIPHKERFGGDGWSYWWSVVKNKRAIGHPLGYVRNIIDQARRDRKTTRERTLDAAGGKK